MNSFNTVPDIIRHWALNSPEKTAFINRSGNSCSFSQLLENSAYVGAELINSDMAGRAAALMGEVGYGGLAVIFGCAMAGCPVVMLDCSLSEERQRQILAEYEVFVLFSGAKHRERAESLGEKLPELRVFCDVEKNLVKESKPVDIEFPHLNPEEPAFLFLSAASGAVMVSHKNICASLAAITAAEDVSSYTFLSPAVWGGAFDCVMGILLPLSAGCAIVKRGEKRSVARAIAESDATALTCTPARLRGLERSLKIKSEKERGKAEIAVSDFFGKLLGFKFSKKMHRKIHRLLGDNLKLIICGGSYPDSAGIRRFLEWGFNVYECYFTSECGPLALSDSPGGKLVPLAELSVPSPIKDAVGEIYVGGDRIPIGYFGGKTEFENGFPTGDIGEIREDGSLKVFGKKKSLLYDKNGEMIFPEELSAGLCRSRYIEACTVTGRFDTKTNDIILTANITPDYREVKEAIGGKYSDNRLKLFFNRVMDKAAANLPHKVHEFRLPD